MISERPRSPLLPPPWLRGALWTWAVLFSLFGLWRGSLFPWDEGLTGERAREMLLGTSWLTPSFNFHPDFHKPPLYYWLAAALMRCAGVRTWAVRLPSALLALACLAVVERWARRAAGSAWAGLVALALLATNPHWLNLTRQGLLDSGMALGMLVAADLLTTRSGAGERPVRLKRFHFAARGAGAGCALAGAALIKTPLAFTLLLPLAFVLALDRAPRRAWRPMGWAVLCGVALAAPWFIFQSIRWGSAFTHTYFVEQHLGQFRSAVEQMAHGPAYYPLEWLRCASALAVAVLLALILQLNPRTTHPPARTGWLILGFMLLGLTCSASKRDTYLVLLYPFAAICAAATLVPWALRSIGPRPLAMAATLTFAGMAAVCLANYQRHLEGSPGLRRILEPLARTLSRPTIIGYLTYPQCILFYSGAHVERTDQVGLLASARRCLASYPAGAVYVLAPRSDAADATKRLHGEVTILRDRSNAHWTLLAIAPPAAQRRAFMPDSKSIPPAPSVP